MTLIKDKKSTRLFTILYFAIGIAGVLGEWLKIESLNYLAKAIVPLFLMLMYWVNSKERNMLFFLIMLLSLATNVFLVSRAQNIMTMAMIIFMVHRIIMIYYVFIIQQIKDLIPMILGMIPFLIIYFYLFLITEIPESSFFILIVQNLLASIWAGIAVSSYFMSDNKANMWLLISGLMFAFMHFAFFIERIFLKDSSITIFGPIIMLVIVFAYFTFYKYVLSSEVLNRQNSAVS